MNSTGSFLTVQLKWHTLQQNEKKKDKELTARIEKILKQKEEAVKGVDLGKLGVSLFHSLRILKPTPTARIELAVDHLVRPAPTTLSSTIFFTN